MKKKLLALLMGTSLVLAACGGGDDASKGTGGDTAAVNAEDVYKKSCAACHGGDLKGGAGPDLTKVGAQLSASDIETIIHEGKGTMPAQNLKDDEATAVAEWLAAKK